MQTLSMLRRQTIRSLTSESADGETDADMILWDQIAVQISLLVGRDGFDSLYARSVFLSQSQYPWLSDDVAVKQTSSRFANLSARLKAQPKSDAIDANCLLLVTLTDILASLIGEPLTTKILDSAWGNGSHIKSGKENNNA